ncbi:MAG: secretin N-terminal domain-containing protein, partial [Bdellovibrionota bacterium]
TASRTSRTRTSTRAASEQGVIQKVVADDRTNSLIVLGSERGIEQVRRFVEEIDVAVDGGDGQIHVYPLQNVKAEDIAQTLASLTQGSSRAPTTTRTTTRNSNAQSSNAGSASADLFDGGVKVTADSRTNSLVIQASPRDFETLKTIVQKLDVRRRQVFIESVILETTVGGGSEWKNQVNSPIFRTNKLGSTDPDVGTPKSGGLLGIGSFTNSEELLGTLGGLVGTSALAGMALGFQSGARVKFSAPSPNGGAPVEYEVPLLSAILRLASTNSNLNVLSTPHILATANEEATISIGEEIPQISSTQGTTGSSVVSNYTRIRVATELAITPQINAGDYLTLNIKQKVNQRGEEVIAGQYAINTREAATTAIVKDGQTIVIGGIMRDQTDNFVSKVPFLGDIPILGWLFKSKRAQSRKVNLLLFLTPHIINEDNDADEVLFKKIKERQDFLKEQGLSEKQGLPLGGLKPEYLEMLDEEYLQSLELEPRVSAKPSVNSNSAPSTEPSATPAPAPKPPKRETSIIPVMPTPRSSPDDYIDE